MYIQQAGVCGLVPRRSGEENTWNAWYTLFAHARNLKAIMGIILKCVGFHLWRKRPVNYTGDDRVSSLIASEDY